MNFSIKEFFDENRQIYGIPNDRLCSNEDLLHYQQKFLLYYLQKQSQGENDQAIKDLIISICWFGAIINRFHLDLGQIMAKRYSCKCPFCLSIPCVCENPKNKLAKKTDRPASRVPKKIPDWQKLAKRIYPDQDLVKMNSLLLYQHDNLNQAFRRYIKEKGKIHLKELEIASADYFVLLLRTFNVLEKDLNQIYSEMFARGCYVCHKTPCECNYFG